MPLLVFKKCPGRCASTLFRGDLRRTHAIRVRAAVHGVGAQGHRGGSTSARESRAWATSGMRRPWFMAVWRSNW